jgi:hypothetical protein
MILLNHAKNLDLLGVFVPDTGSTRETNAATGPNSIGEHSELCKSTWGREPNVVLVDNFNIGLFLSGCLSVPVLIGRRGRLYGSE